MHGHVVVGQLQHSQQYTIVGAAAETTAHLGQLWVLLSNVSVTLSSADLSDLIVPLTIAALRGSFS